LLIALITFALGLYGPGDPVDVMLGERGSSEARERLRRELGLDRPFFVQYLDYVWRALHGDFGESFKYRGQPVRRLIGQCLWVSIQLNLAVMAVGIFIGIPLGVIAALKRNTWIDYLAVFITVGSISFPSFVRAPILLWLFAWWLRILPSGGWEGIFSTRIIMPVMVLSAGPIAVFTRQTRASMLEVLSQDYVRTARAKGLTEKMVIIGHALRNALIPLFTIFGLMVGGLVGGAIITEAFFGIPGIGRLVFASFAARDYPVITTFTLIVAVSYTLASLLIDVCYGFLDPRIRYQ
jgi:peptide/nickel transport system permease protein